MKLWLLFLESLQVSSFRITGLWFWLLHLSASHKQATVGNEHLDSPLFFLSQAIFKMTSDFFIIGGRHTQKKSFCSWNQGPLYFKTVPISFCNCGGRNSNLAFCPQENTESWAWGSLKNSTYFHKMWSKKCWAYGFKEGWQVSCVTTRSGCHRQAARPNCGILSKPVGQAGQLHILIACQVQGPSCPPSNLKWRQCKQSKSVAHSQESMAWEVGWVGTQRSYHTHCIYWGPRYMPGDILPAWKERTVHTYQFPLSPLNLIPSSEKGS